jgi:biofilm protein TabA
MNISRLIKITGVLLLLIIAGKVSAQTDSAKAAKKWVKSRAWANGFKAKVYPDINDFEFYRQYNKAKATWDKAFAFLADTHKLDTIKPGTYPIDANAYASVTDGPEKSPDVAKWESHRKNIDLQYIIRGKESMAMAPVTSATVIVPYNEKKDAANYTADGKYYVATPDEFFLFFPSEAHKPSMKVEGYDEPVKKIVIKIHYLP